MKKLITICAIAAVILTASDQAQAATLNVPSDYLTIQAAINASINGDEVVVANGTYTGTGNRDIDFLGKAITVCSENGPENCIIDCQGSIGDEHRGFYFHSGETSSAVLDGFTIINGYIWVGAAICCNNSSPIIINNVIADNWSRGGAIYCDNSSPSIIKNIIKDNSPPTGEGAAGGGIFCWDNSSPNITNNTIIGNSASYGGGINCNLNCSPSITNNIIVGNSAETQGGGIYCGVSSPDIINNTIIRNSATLGGGIYCEGSSPDIINNTIIRNWATRVGGICCYRDSFPTVINTILWLDSPQEIYIDLGSSVAVTYSCIQGGWAGEGNIDAYPLFADADGRLSPGSPCINAGDNSAVLIATDLDGNPRIAGPIVDMGAFEVQPAELLLDLTYEVIDLDLQSGIENSLLAKLDAAQKANDSVAINLLQSFINAVEAQRGNKITEDDAVALIAAAQQIIDLLGSG